MFLVAVIILAGISLISCESLFKAHIINLAHRPNRLASITNQLKSYDIPFEVFSAITPADIETEINLRKENKKSERFDPETKMIFRPRSPQVDGISPTQIGCTQSHLQILLKQSQLNSTAPFLILEDDIKLESDFYNRSIDLMRKIKGPWEVLLVGYVTAGFYDCDPLGERGSDYCKLKKIMIAGSQGYFLNGSKAAKTILNMLNTPEPIIYDYLLASSSDKFYISLPKLVSPDYQFPSDNPIN